MAVSTPLLNGHNIMYSVGYLIDTTSCESVLNGVTQTFTSGQNGVYKTDQLFRFLTDTTLGFEGELFEVIIYDRKLSPTEDTAVKDYLRAKYQHY